MMSTIQAIEVRISRDIIRRREQRSSQVLAEEVISVVSIVATMGVLALFFPAVFLLAALAATVVCLGT